jgi:hypothetical protein
MSRAESRGLSPASRLRLEAGLLFTSRSSPAFTAQNEDYLLSYQHAAIRNARLHATLKLECPPWPRVETGCRNAHYPPIHKKI